MQMAARGKEEFKQATVYLCNNGTIRFTKDKLLRKPDTIVAEINRYIRK